MLSIEQIRKLLVDRRPKIVSERTGLQIVTITTIRDGKNTNPRFETVQILSDYLDGKNEY